jgi:hypothetical protein
VGVSRTLLAVLLALSLAAAFSACGGGQSRSSTTASGTGKTHTVRSRSCERNPHDGVHGPDRLRVLRPCAAFEGTVTEAPVKNSDGDVSFQASPDPGYANMLNAHNRSEHGLHIEIVPRDQRGCTPGRAVVFGDIPNLGRCSGRNVAVPPLGAHVRIIGPWVLDRSNNWYEIHPAWSIRILH